VDSASPSLGEEELRGVSIHVELIVGGDDFEPVIDDVLMEDRGASFFIHIAELAKSWVYSWHWAARC
jgi:hypothetical protein